MVLTTCAAYERDVAAGVRRPDWIGVGYFLVDASAGMLAAPVTHRSEVPSSFAAALV